MTTRHRIGLALLLLLHLLLAGGCAARSAPATDPAARLFVPGQAYMFVMGCLPSWVAAAAEQQAGQRLNPCYVDVLTVVIVRPDGWLITRDLNGYTWAVNLAQMQSARQVTITPAAAQPPQSN